MSPGGRSERIGFLRSAIGRIEAAEGVRAAGTARVLSTGAAAFDRALGGGVRADGLHEIVAASAADSGAALGFALALAQRAMEAGGTLVWIGEEFATLEQGAPYGPGLGLHGIAPERLVLVRTVNPRETLWALEEATKSGAPAVLLGELGRAGALYDLAASRRLVLAARAGGRPCLLLHAGLPGQAEAISSAAETRIAIAARPSPALPPPGGPPALPGLPAWSAHLVKRRGGAGAARPFGLVWDAAERRMSDDKREPNLSLDLPALSGGGAAPAAQRRVG